jgi:predicted GH43/DUF377 family glycosyl hydrolase
MALIKRFAKNPILTAADIPYEVSTVHNAGVIKYKENYIMLFRSHLKNGRSIIGLAKSKDGFNFNVAKGPFLIPAEEGIFKEYEEYGVEDPRITKLEEKYYITYSAYSRHGVRIGLAVTKDFSDVKRISFITEADQRNVVLFPEKINDKYFRLDRPHTEINPWSIWLSSSPDLLHWGDARVIIKPQQYHWDEMKIGAGAPPVKTSRGWLVIYHGVFQTMSGSVYRLGLALLDLKDPGRVISVCDRWLLQPEEVYERTGYVPNVVFCCGAVPEKDGSIKIYWGGADQVMCVGTAKINELVEYCLKYPRPPL